MDKAKIIQETAAYVRAKMSAESAAGHDWWHAERVWKNSLHICASETADTFIVQLGALLHDIADYKFNNGDDTAAPRLARAWLEKCEVEENVIAHICDMIEDLGYKGAGVPTPMKTKEGMIVQDADRLDALGAIGIARAFAYGGSKQRDIYDPTSRPEMHTSFADYKKNTGSTVNHFYEKLLLLKDRMNTAPARRIAQSRHEFMEQYLAQFYKEWDGKA